MRAVTGKENERMDFAHLPLSLRITKGVLRDNAGVDVSSDAVMMK